MKIADVSVAVRANSETGAVANRAEPLMLKLPGTSQPNPAAPAVAQDAARQPTGRPAARPKAEDAARVADKLNRAAELFNVQAKFSVHKGTKEIMVKIIDTSTGRVLREIPPERMLDLAASMQHLLGLVVDKKA